MFSHKKIIGTWNLCVAIAFFVLILVATFGEALLFKAYIDSLEEKSLEGLGILVVIIYGVALGILLLVSGVLALVAAIGLYKCTTRRKANTYAVVGIVGKILGGAGLLFYAIIMFSLYPYGIPLKILYVLLSGLVIYRAVADAVLCGKKNTEAVATAEE